MGNLDVDALYPSLDIERCSEVVSNKHLESEITFERLDWKEIALYLRYHMDEDEIQREGYGVVCPVRRSNLGRPPIFTTSGSSKDDSKRLDPWVFGKRPPSRRKIRRMFCYAIRLMMRETMKSHDFQFNGHVYRQREGGSIRYGPYWSYI